MRKSRFSEEQIIALLCEQEAGARPRRSVAGTASAAPRSTNGRRGTAGWRCLMRAG